MYVTLIDRIQCFENFRNVSLKIHYLSKCSLVCFLLVPLSKLKMHGIFSQNAGKNVGEVDHLTNLLESTFEKLFLFLFPRNRLCVLPITHRYFYSRMSCPFFY